MHDSAKSKAQLIAELQGLRVQLAACRPHGVEPQADERLHQLEQQSQAIEDVYRLLDCTPGRMDPILDSLITAAHQLLRADAAALFRLDAPAGVLELQAVSDLPDAPTAARMPIDRLIERALAARHPLAATRADSNAAAPGTPAVTLVPWTPSALLGQPYATVLVVPLATSDASARAIVLYWLEDRTIAGMEVQLAAAFGTYAAHVIALAQLFVVAQRAAALDERQRLARELHDSATQAFYTVKLYAEAAARRMAAGDTATAITYVHELRSIAQDAVQDLRLLIYELRPPILDQEGLAVAIQSRLDAVEGRTGVQTEFVVESDLPLTAAVEQALYRVVQEALNNALKHAKAHRITVRLQHAPQQTRLTITDDGVGFDLAAAPAQGGLGLRGMAERMAQLGGRLTVDSSPGQGTVVKVEVPT